MGKNVNNSGSIRQKTISKPDGTIYTYWEARFSVGNDPVTGKPVQKSISGKSQREVAQKMKAAIAAVEAGTYSEPSKLTVREWMETWLDEYIAISGKPLTVQAYRSRIKLHILPALGAYKLTQLNPSMLQAWSNSLTRDKGLSGKTALNVVAILQTALKQAVRLGYIAVNPVDAVIKPRKKKHEIKPLSEDEIRAFLREVDEDKEYSALFRVTIFTGLREGEVCGLSWDEVDFKNGTITVKQQLQKGKEAGDQHKIVTTKNDRTRVITAPDYVMDVLRETRKEQNRNRIFYGTDYRNDWNLCFTHADGSFLPPQSALKHFKKIAERIGRPDARFHDLRHTYAVTALQEGDDVKTVQENLGHATASFTLDVYGHVSEKMKEESKNRMDKFIESIS